jgi:NTP pyrophosphatase (non-canonical NTP hydrolase)
MTKRNLAWKALEKWGPEAQFDMVIEECSELITSIVHYKRGRISKDDMCQEVADVEIMLEFMRIQLGDHYVNRVIAEKLERLNGRIEED